MEALIPAVCLPVFATEEDKNQNDSKNCVEKDINTDPWPGYRYSGKLRPHYPLVRSCCCHSLSVGLEGQSGATSMFTCRKNTFNYCSPTCEEFFLKGPHTVRKSHSLLFFMLPCVLHTTRVQGLTCGSFWTHRL